MSVEFTLPYVCTRIEKTTSFRGHLCGPILSYSRSISQTFRGAVPTHSRLGVIDSDM